VCKQYMNRLVRIAVTDTLATIEELLEMVRDEVM
jgi:hypothetical protein